MGNLTSLSKIYGFPYDPDEDYEKLESFYQKNNLEYDIDDDGVSGVVDFMNEKYPENPSLDYGCCGFMSIDEGAYVIGVKTESLNNYFGLPFPASDFEFTDEITPEDEAKLQKLREELGYVDDEAKIGWYVCVNLG